jgi:hypothetical protein
MQVVGGLMLNQLRRTQAMVCDHPHAYLTTVCMIKNQVLRAEALKRHHALSPYGTDPMFNKASRLYSSGLEVSADGIYSG